MRWGRRARRTISVVVPVYRVEDYLPACLDSILAQSVQGDPAHGADLDVVVVDDGSPDDSGAIADSYAAHDPRVRVVHTTNRGLGAARNEGLRHVRGDLLAFADSDDVVPPEAYAALLRQQRRTGADLVTGSMAWWEGDALREPPWMRRLHRAREAVVIEQHPEVLGDVFAWNKLFTRSFWDAAGLSWPEGVRYEDQPTTTEAYLRARRIGLVPDVVYHYRVRHDGTSITQQRGALDDLRDRWTTKRMALASVTAYGSAPVSKVFHARVLGGDLHQYLRRVPGCSDEYWQLLRAGVLEFFATSSLARTDLPPVQRLAGWLVEQDRRAETAAVMTYLAGLAPGERAPRATDERGRRLDLPVIDAATVPRAVLALRDDER